MGGRIKVPSGIGRGLSQQQQQQQRQLQLSLGVMTLVWAVARTLFFSLTFAMAEESTRAGGWGGGEGRSSGCAGSSLVNGHDAGAWLG